MRKLCITIGLFSLISSSYAQNHGTGDNVWSLQRCVQYAIEHNISIKQNVLNADQAEAALKQSRLSQLPAVSVNGSYGKSLGRSINPTTNQFVDAGYNFLSASGNGSLLLFGWMQVRNTIDKNKYTLQASLADLDQLKDDVSLNVATSFLVAVLSKEQITISNNQVALSKAQLGQTRAFAEAGRLPELNVAQLEAQLASDSANLINAIANFNANILDLKTLLNLDFAEPFAIQVPDVEPGDQVTTTTTLPEEIFDKARMRFGAIKASQLRVEAARKGVAAARGNLYPQLSLGYQVGTNYASNYQTVSSFTQNGFSPIGVADTVLLTPVYQPNIVPVLANIPFNDQFNNNIRHSVYLNLNVPILNGWQSRYAIRQASINLASQQLNEYNAALTLRQNVYKAHNNAVNAIQKYNAAKRADDAARRALDFAQKRYDLGLTSTVDLLVIQNNAFTAASNLAIGKYDLIFKLKVIDYYLGKQLKL
ncbi:MAG: TolC family protein [Bacteroidota bacterium]